MSGRRAVFLDRDGTLNRAIVCDGKPASPATLAAFQILPGVAAAVAALKAAGYLTVVVTNQPDVARGLLSAEAMAAMHAALRAAVPVDDIRACVCIEGPGCDCYKPKPGMLLEAARDWGIDLAASHMIGDRWRDVGAGRAAGCTTYFIDRGYAEALPVAPDHRVEDMPAAARHILAQGGAAGRGRPRAETDGRSRA